MSRRFDTTEAGLASITGTELLVSGVAHAGIKRNGRARIPACLAAQAQHAEWL